MPKKENIRAGKYINQPTGYKAFMPNPLPPEPPLHMDAEMQVLLSAADRALGKLDAATELLPNPDWFVDMYVKKEAVYSSQIEGAQASLADLLEFEVKIDRDKLPMDVKETSNYVKALNYGLERLNSLPLSLRLLKEIHKKLMHGVRGGEKSPGEFRDKQNFIGPPGCMLNEATFAPPPPQELLNTMGALEKFLHDESPMPPLIKCGLAHAQFETIHPFYDGNGRIGRLLITFLLAWRGMLKKPLLYVSHYFKKNHSEYYDRLQAVRENGDWEGWIRFFLTGVEEVSIEAAETAQKIQFLRRDHEKLIGEAKLNQANSLALLEDLFRFPFTNSNLTKITIKKSHPVAIKLLNTFEKLGILKELSGKQRYKFYAYKPYLDLFQ
ncbi:Fic domain protein, Pden_3305 type [hydrothermal vent metagenome]|uniref:Fic domain protein, Pden_3305 type n=2 Tax=hydrothermal vent metagenome TaxID=652676 RepID=A0A3B1CY76_9ZZZZ